MASIGQKLQLKPAYNLLLLNAPAELQHLFAHKCATLTAADTTTQEAAFDAVQVFVTTKAELDVLAPQAIAALKPDGLLWIAYPKKSSAIKSDLTRDYGWETIAALGYEGVRLVAIDDTWSSLRFRHKQERKEPSKMGTDYPGIDRATKTVTVPADLHQALKQAGLTERFANLAFTHRKEHVISVLEAKRPETRENRVAKVVEKLLTS